MNITGRLPAGESDNTSLFERARAGDLDAFESLLRSHERQVLGTAVRLLSCREDAQDAAQEVFVRLFRHLKRIQSGEAVAPWLYRVTVNVCADVRRRRRPQTDMNEIELASSGPDPEAVASIAERERAVSRGLETLSQKERAALVLREVEGLSTREVAGILGSSEVTVRAQISTARMKLRKFTDRYLRKKL